VTRGILDLARVGAVTSASLLTNLPGSLEALTMAQSAGLDLGVHLNLCLGAPLSPPELVSSLVDAAGWFHRSGAVALRLASGRLHLDEVEREWARQIETVLAWGVQPSHVDSHGHFHAWPPLYARTVCLARQHAIAGVRNAFDGYMLHSPHWSSLRWTVRRPGKRTRTVSHPDHFTVLSVWGYASQLDTLRDVLRALPPGVTELVCHPGHVDEDLRRLDRLTDAREDEQAVLSHPLARDTLAREGIQLVSWADAWPS
jgi:predicted glycoside hydrolase/deacetylase ChbG (UPF0249 family)